MLSKNKLHTPLDHEIELSRTFDGEYYTININPIMNQNTKWKTHNFYDDDNNDAEKFHSISFGEPLSNPFVHAVLPRYAMVLQQ